MSFGEKFRRAVKKIKGKLIVSFILWLILVIVFVAPFGLSTSRAVQVNNGDSNPIRFSGEAWEKFFNELFFDAQNMVHPISSTISCIKGEANGYFFGTLWKFSLVYLLAVTIGISKAFPKHEFDGIENGSSDWCQNGEQYQILSNKAGLILAEKNYLPVDKRGNVNVLVVGRFWCW